MYPFYLYFFVSRTNKRKLPLNIIYFSLSLLHNSKRAYKSSGKWFNVGFLLFVFEEINMFIKRTESTTGKHPWSRLKRNWLNANWNRKEYVNDGILLFPLRDFSQTCGIGNSWLKCKAHFPVKNWTIKYSLGLFACMISNHWFHLLQLLLKVGSLDNLIEEFSLA